MFCDWLKNLHIYFELFLFHSKWVIEIDLLIKIRQNSYKTELILFISILYNRMNLIEKSAVIHETMIQNYFISILFSLHIWSINEFTFKNRSKVCRLHSSNSNTTLFLELASPISVDWLLNWTEIYFFAVNILQSCRCYFLVLIYSFEA